MKMPPNEIEQKQFLKRKEASQASTLNFNIKYTSIEVTKIESKRQTRFEIKQQYFDDTVLGYFNGKLQNGTFTAFAEHDSSITPVFETGIQNILQKTIANIVTSGMVSTWKSSKHLNTIEKQVYEGLKTNPNLRVTNPSGITGQRYIVTKV